MQRLIAETDSGAHATDLGGVMSLNVRLGRAGLVLRVQQPFVSRARLLALQEVRLRLASQGLVIPVPVRRGNAAVLRCGDRWAELERYVPHERLPPELGSYAWLFGAMGTLHRTLAGLDLPVPRPLVSTYAPPGSLRRWLPATEAAVAGDLEAAEIARLLHDLVRRLRGQWVPASASSTSDDDGIPADALTVAGANWRLPILWCSVSRHDADTARLQPDGCLVWAELTRW